MAISVVSFSFWCSTGGPRAQLSTGWWLSLLHLISNFSEPQLIRGSKSSLHRAFSTTSYQQLLWMMAFFTASYHQLVSKIAGGPEGPFGREWLSLPHLVYNSHSNWSLTVLTELYNSSTPTQSLASHVWSSSSGNHCHVVQRSLSSGASVYECIMGFFPCPILLARSTYTIVPHKCHRNVSLPSGASLWNGKFGRVEGQNTTLPLVIYLLNLIFLVELIQSMIIIIGLPINIEVYRLFCHQDLLFSRYSMYFHEPELDRINCRDIGNECLGKIRRTHFHCDIWIDSGYPPTYCFVFILENMRLLNFTACENNCK